MKNMIQWLNARYCATCQTDFGGHQSWCPYR